MSGYVRWKDVRAEHVARADGEEAVHAGKEEMLARCRGSARSAQGGVQVAQVAGQRRLDGTAEVVAAEAGDRIRGGGDPAAVSRVFALLRHPSAGPDAAATSR